MGGDADGPAPAERRHVQRRGLLVDATEDPGVGDRPHDHLDLVLPPEPPLPLGEGGLHDGDGAGHGERSGRDVRDAHPGEEPRGGDRHPATGGVREHARLQRSGLTTDRPLSAGRCVVAGISYDDGETPVGAPHCGQYWELGGTGWPQPRPKRGAAVGVARAGETRSVTWPHAASARTRNAMASTAAARDNPTRNPVREGEGPKTTASTTTEI